MNHKTNYNEKVEGGERECLLRTTTGACMISEFGERKRCRNKNGGENRGFVKGGSGVETRESVAALPSLLYYCRK